MGSKRDDFPAGTKTELAERVQYICSNPACRAATIASKENARGVVKVGEAAHIEGAAPGGPRYNEEQTSEERASIENGIWLCRICAKIIDADDGAHPAELLIEWKQHAESIVRQNLGRPMSAVSVSESALPPVPTPPTNFVGYNAELTTIISALTAGIPVIVSGFPGAGKTTVVSKALEEYLRDHKNAPLWISLSAKSSIVQLAPALATHLDPAGRSASLPDLERVKHLLDEAEHRKLFLVIDSLDGVEGSLVSEIYNHCLTRFRAARVCLLMRDVPLHGYAAESCVVSLVGLSGSDAMHLASSTSQHMNLSLSPLELSEICERASCLPYLLMVILTLSQATTVDDVLADTAGLTTAQISTYLNKEVGAILSPAERQVLQVFAQAPGPLRMSILSLISACSPAEVADAFLRLRRRNLLLPWLKEWFMVHDLARAIQLGSGNSEDMLLDYYQALPERVMGEAVDEIRLLICSSKDNSDLIRRADELSRNLLFFGYVEACMLLVDGMVARGAASFTLLYTRGRMLRFRGEHRLAVAAYSEAGSLMPLNSAGRATARLEQASALLEAPDTTETERQNCVGVYKELAGHEDISVQTTALLALHTFAERMSDKEALSKQLFDISERLPAGSRERLSAESFLGHILLTLPEHAADGEIILQKCLKNSLNERSGLGNNTLLLARISTWLTEYYCETQQHERLNAVLRQSVPSLVAAGAVHIALDVTMTGANHHFYGCRYPESYTALAHLELPTTLGVSKCLDDEAFAKGWVERCRILACCAWRVGNLEAAIEAILEYQLICTAFEQVPVPFVMVRRSDINEGADVPPFILVFPDGVGIDDITTIATALMERRPELQVAGSTILAGRNEPGDAT